jgi:hypothetical protein
MYYAKDPNKFGDPKPEKNQPQTKSKPKPLTLVEQLDRVFSIFIRKSSCNEHGIGRCYTCDEEYHWKDLQCGHFQNRVNMGTRFSEYNCKSQCFTCNIEKRGNVEEFEKRLIKEYGDNVVQYLKIDARRTHKISQEELKEGIEYYKAQNKKFEYIK